MDAPAILIGEHPPTDEQVAIFDAARTTQDNLMIEAYAGCGKTRTLEALSRAIPGKNPILYLVFNKKNAEEAADVMPYNCEVRTLNAFGHRAWAAKIYTKLNLSKSKTGDILREIIGEAKNKSAEREIWSVFSQITDGVNRAKAFGYVPESYPQAQSLLTRSAFHKLLDEEPDDLVSDLVDAVLSRSIAAAFKGTVDFNDQVYMPALFGGSFSRFPTTLVDEYQDLSPVNHKLLARAVKGRIIGVGDRFQNIYGFRGAKAGGMLEAITNYSMKVMPLSLTFRCPEAIVNHVRWRVPTFRAKKQGGSVVTPKDLEHVLINDNWVVICRNNAPLFSLAIRLLSTGQSVTIAGSDIGPKLVGIMRKLGPETLSRAQALSLVDQWLADKLASQSKSAEDLADCMRVFLRNSRDLGQAISYAEHILNAQGKTLLTTGHKAKGLEWDGVIHLDPWLVRRNPDEQNQNLDYVISTRSADRLLEIDSEAILWDEE